MSRVGKITDLSLNIISLCAFIGASFLLNRIISSQGRIDLNVKNKILGKVLLNTNETKNKAEGSFIWYPVKQDQLIYDGDSVFTDSDASVTLAFSQGQTLKIAPETLIVIRESHSILELEPVFGHFQSELKSGSNLHIRTGQHLLKVAGTKSSSLSFEQMNRFTQPVIQSNVEIAVESTFDSAPNSNLTVEEVKPVIFDSFTFSDLKLTPFAIWAKATSFLNFEWTGSGNAKIFVLTISKSSNFDLPFRTYKLSDSFLKTVPNDLEPGNYFWKIEALNDQEKVVGISMISRFMVQEQIIPLVRLANSEISFEPHAVNFDWLKISIAEEYKAEISITADFSNIINQTTTTENQWKPPLLKGGNYFFRVGASVNHVVFYSKTVPFTIVEAAIIDPKPSDVPISLLPEHFKNPELAIETKIINNDTSRQEIELSWGASPEWKSFALSYQVCTSPNTCIPHQEIVLTSNEATEHYKITVEQECELNIELGIHENLGKQVKPIKKIIPLWSSKPLEIPKLKTPLNNSKIVKTDNKQPLIFKWSAVPRASSYELEISESEFFSDPMIFRITTNNFAWSSPSESDKLLYWKVRSLKKEAQLKSDFSNPQSFSIELQFDPRQSD